MTGCSLPVVADSIQRCSGITNDITPIQSHWNDPTARVIDLRDDDAEMDVTIDYNNAVNIGAIPSPTSPDELEKSGDAVISFAEALLTTPGISSFFAFAIKLLLISYYFCTFAL